MPLVRSNVREPTYDLLVYQPNVREPIQNLDGQVLPSVLLPKHIYFLFCSIKVTPVGVVSQVCPNATDVTQNSNEKAAMAPNTCSKRCLPMRSSRLFLAVSPDIQIYVPSTLLRVDVSTKTTSRLAESRFHVSLKTLSLYEPSPHLKIFRFFHCSCNLRQPHVGMAR